MKRSKIYIFILIIFFLLYISTTYFIYIENKTNLIQNTKQNYQLFMNLIASLIFLILGFGTIIFMTIIPKKLFEKQLLLGHFTNSPTLGVLLTDKDRKIIFINKVFEKIFDLKSKDSYGKSLDSIMTNLECIDGRRQISYFSNKKEDLLFMKSNSSKKDEKVYMVQVTPLLNKYQKELEGSIVTVNDITHEKNLKKKEIEAEQILIQNSKIAALEDMINTLSYQLNKPFSTLLMLISNIEETISKENLLKANNYLLRSRKTIEQMKETINVFQNFHEEDLKKTKLNLIEAIDEIILISYPQMVINGIDLEFIYDKNNDYICENYHSYIKQVLINLIGNAKDELSHVLKEKQYYKASIKIFLTKKNDKLYIIVEDNGRGISKENKGKVFEPFFSTKAEGRLGVGLFLCKLLVETKMNGKFILDNISNPTIFVIEINVLDVKNTL